MPVHFLWFLLDWRGRISRSAYRTAILVLGLSVSALQLAPDKLHGILVGLLLAQLVVQAALDAKRLHDIGFSAIWVPATSIACIFAAFALASTSPDAAAMLGRHVHDILGPAADKGGLKAIVLAGLEAGALLRSTLLWAPKSNAGGDVYNYTPGKARLAALDAKGARSLDADAVIAKALAAQMAQARETPAPRAGRTAKPAASTAFGGRKNFGARKSA